MKITHFSNPLVLKSATRCSPFRQETWQGIVFNKKITFLNTDHIGVGVFVLLRHNSQGWNRTVITLHHAVQIQ